MLRLFLNELLSAHCNFPWYKQVKLRPVWGLGSVLGTKTRMCWSMAGQLRTLPVLHRLRDWPESLNLAPESGPPKETPKIDPHMLAIFYFGNNLTSSIPISGSSPFLFHG